MNDTHITITGWVGTTPERREVAGGAVVTSFRVAHQSRRLKDGEWSNGPVTWYQVKAWRRLAEHVASSISRGDPVVVHGRLVADVWTREDGATVSQYVLVATTVGHDLVHGTAEFHRHRQDPVEEAPQVAPSTTEESSPVVEGDASDATGEVAA
ncbi:MAG TPA: single-stranded DNA-binding protein [Nocardioides sp.]